MTPHGLGYSLCKQAYTPTVAGRLAREYDPIRPRREDLLPEEQQAIDAGQNQWFPEAFQSDDTQIANMQASPSKQALMYGAGAGALGAGLGSLVGPKTALAGGLGAGAVAAIMRYLSQNNRNAEITESIRRLPPGATKRDFDNEQAVGDAFDRHYAR